jgi:hypothetical protein
MTKSKRCGRATPRTVRMPATRFGHLQKRMKKRPPRAALPVKK